jgi:hypothetical protein
MTGNVVVLLGLLFYACNNKVWVDTFYCQATVFLDPRYRRLQTPLEIDKSSFVGRVRQILFSSS